VVVSLKKGVADPEGANTLKALKLLGFENVRDVRYSKMFTLSIDAAAPEEAESVAREVGDKLLANPVIHSYSVSVRESE